MHYFIDMAALQIYHRAKRWKVVIEVFLLKTDAETLPKVIEEGKHAINYVPRRAKTGEIILIQQTRRTLGNNEKPIRYAMEFVRCYEDKNNDSTRIWGIKKKYIIEGVNPREIKPNIDLEEIKISTKKYNGQSTLIYIDDQDKWEVSIKTGLVDCD